MAYYRIAGGKKLKGQIPISGAKNAAVAIIPAAILCGQVCTLNNVPDIEDVRILSKLLERIGAKVDFDTDKCEMVIDPRGIYSQDLSCELMKSLRASCYFLGALYGRYGKAKIALPGGCVIGERPMDIHIYGLRELGAVVDLKGDILEAHSKGISYHDGDIRLPKRSVGATINIMLAASAKKAGVTVITNPAKEPHIVDVANFLNAMGADVRGAGTDRITIRPAREWHGCTYEIIPDQIETGTYMIAAAAAGGEVKLKNVIPRHMESLIQVLRDCGAEIEETTDGYMDYLTVRSDGHLKATDITTAPYPGFPTDLQQPMVALLSKAKGTSIVNETIFESRFAYVKQLREMGADIGVSTDNKTAFVHGVERLKGNDVFITDLRAGAALVVAALIAEGVTCVHRVGFLDRGYMQMERKLRELGVEIDRIEEAETE